MTLLLPNIKPQFFDVDGNPLVGGLLYTYSAGTSSEIPTYSDYQGLTANSNPIVLDSRGEADIYLADGSYKFVLKDSEDVTIWTVDNITSEDFSPTATLLSKYTTSHTDLQDASLSTSITSFSLPAKTVIEYLIFKHTELFVGTGITSYKVSVGISGSETLFVDNFDVTQVVADQTFELIDSTYLGSFTSITNILITATAIGANLDQSTAGSLDVFYKTKGMN